MSRLLLWLTLVLLLVAVGLSVAWRFRPRDVLDFNPKAIRVEVANGCGVPRVGRAVAEELILKGFNVYGVSNVRTQPRTTVVELRDSDGKNAVKVARALGIRRRFLGYPLGRLTLPATRVEIDSAAYLEVRLVVGEDYRRFFASVTPLR